MYKNNLDFNIFIPVSKKDKKIVKNAVDNNQKFIQGSYNIFLLSDNKNININNTKFLRKEDFPFSKEEIENKIKNNRAGWVYQQLCKIYFASNLNPSRFTLVLDSDLFFVKPIKFFDKNSIPIYTTSEEFHKPYFDHMQKLLPQLHRFDEKESGIVHHMVFDKKIINEMINKIEKHTSTNFYDAFIDYLDFEMTESPCSEYEMYFNYIQIYHQDNHSKRKLKWKNTSCINKDLLTSYDFFSLPHYAQTRPNNLFKNIFNCKFTKAYMSLVNLFYLLTIKSIKKE